MVGVFVGLEEVDRLEVRVVGQVLQPVGLHHRDRQGLQHVQPFLGGLGQRRLGHQAVELVDVLHAGEIVGEPRVLGDGLGEAGHLEELVPLLVGVGQEADVAILGLEGPPVRMTNPHIAPLAGGRVVVWS